MRFMCLRKNVCVADRKSPRLPLLQDSLEQPFHGVAALFLQEVHDHTGELLHHLRIEVQALHQLFDQIHLLFLS